jgi:hypothetical protein
MRRAEEATTMRATAWRAVAAWAVLVGAAAADDAGPWVRVNLVGYGSGDPKVAVLSSRTPLSGTFRVGDVEAPIGPDGGAWGPFAHNYRLDFSALKAPGRYRVRAAGVESAEFAVGPDAYREVGPALLGFVQGQRCGTEPLQGPPCHARDGFDSIDGRMLDLTGGWHDAADRLKHMITTSYCVAALLLAGGEGARAEGLYGAKLLKRIHPAPDVLYVQIGDDRDHMPPQTLPHEDRSDYGRGPGGPRTGWRATGRPDGPKYQNRSDGLANLAGRCAAALALAGDVEAARSLYRLAQKNLGAAMSVPVKAPYYYGERTYWDDLEWGAVELYRATKEPRYLEEAIAYADRAADNPVLGSDGHGHYELFPYANLAHARLHEFVDATTQARLAGYVRAGLERVRRKAERNPYRIGTPFVWCSVNDVIAVAIEATLYERMTGDATYRGLGAEARDWIFGRNPWGVSLVVGVPAGGRSSSKPHHLLHRLTGTPPVGGLVDGPVSRAINDGLKFEPFGADELAAFQSDVAVYHDVFADFSTNEPILDGTVSLLLLVELWGRP